MNREQTPRTINTHLGEIAIENEEMVRITNGILGFEEFKEYIIIEKDEHRPFKWMISVENPALSFVVIEPLLFFPEYAPNISKTDLKNLQIDDTRNSRIYSIVTLASVPDEITVNLSGPICINKSTLVGKQIALTGDTYSTKHNLFKHETKLVKEDILC
ncbi:flagellar assembly protein FliW [candidate division KSB1 bacterium]|nr:flagellar assembly protein FliW [candidate division KSB1 bacterium]